MINLDMIGRMKNNQLTVGGIGTAELFEKIVDNANKSLQIDLSKSASGQGQAIILVFTIKIFLSFSFIQGATMIITNHQMIGQKLI